MVTVGRVARPHGRVGHVIVRSESDFAAERFRIGETVYALRGEVVTALVVDASREHQGRWVVGFEGVTSIDDAETLRDHELRIAAADVKPLQPGVYYTFDLVGCEVRTTAGDVVGRVESVDLAAGTPLLVVMGQDEVLVPLSAAICRRIDVAGKVVEIDPPEGLIDLNWKKPRA